MYYKDLELWNQIEYYYIFILLYYFTQIIYAYLFLLLNVFFPDHKNAANFLISRAQTSYSFYQ